MHSGQTVLFSGARVVLAKPHSIQGIKPRVWIWETPVRPYLVGDAILVVFVVRDFGYTRNRPNPRSPVVRRGEHPGSVTGPTHAHDASFVASKNTPRVWAFFVARVSIVIRRRHIPRHYLPFIRPRCPQLHFVENRASRYL